MCALLQTHIELFSLVIQTHEKLPWTQRESLPLFSITLLSAVQISFYHPHQQIHKHPNENPFSTVTIK